MSTTSQSWIEREAGQETRLGKLRNNSAGLTFAVLVLYGAYAFMLGIWPFPAERTASSGNGLVRLLATSHPSLVVTIGGIIPVWRYSLNTPGSWPRLFEFGDGAFAVDSSDQGVLAVSKWGRKLWTFEIPDESGAESYQGTAVLAIAGKSGTWGVTADGHPAWFRKGLFTAYPYNSTIRVDETVVLNTEWWEQRAGHNQVASLSATGEVLWTAKVPGEEIGAALAGSGGHAFVIVYDTSKNSKCGYPYDGHLLCYGPTGKLKWDYEATPWSLPASISVTPTSVEYLRTTCSDGWGTWTRLDYKGKVIGERPGEQPSWTK